MITEEFLTQLSSSAPVPGGGGVSALVGALSASLASMVGNLTTGKKKYAEYQQDIERIIDEAAGKRDELFGFIAKDAEAFEPLSRAYGIPKDEPGRDEKLEEALLHAAEAPLDLMKAIAGIVPMLEELSVKGSRLAISDVGVAAALAAAASKGAVMNVYINTKLMKNKDVAVQMNKEAAALLEDTVKRSEKVYDEVLGGLLG